MWIFVCDQTAQSSKKKTFFSFIPMEKWKILLVLLVPPLLLPLHILLQSWRSWVDERDRETFVLIFFTFWSFCCCISASPLCSDVTEALQSVEDDLLTRPLPRPPAGSPGVERKGLNGGQTEATKRVWGGSRENISSRKQSCSPANCALRQLNQ